MKTGSGLTDRPAGGSIIGGDRPARIAKVTTGFCTREDPRSSAPAFPRGRAGVSMGHLQAGVRVPELFARKCGAAGCSVYDWFL